MDDSDESDDGDKSIKSAGDIWNDVFNAVYEPTPEINQNARRNFLNVIKQLRPNSAVPLVIDTGVSL